MKHELRHRLNIGHWLIPICLAAILLSAPAHAAEVAARVQFVVGQVIATTATGERRRLGKGDEVFAGDLLESSIASAAQLVFSDNGRMAIRASTVLKVEDYHYDKSDNGQQSNAFFELFRGAVRSITGLIGKANRHNVLLVTPVATIGIRGTDHETVHIPLDSADEGPAVAAGTYNKVYSGATTLRSALGELPLEPGQVGFVAGSPGDASAPVLVEDLPDAFYQEMQVRNHSGQSDSLAGSGLVDNLVTSMLASDADALELDATIGTIESLDAAGTVSALSNTAGGALGQVLDSGFSGVGSAGGSLSGTSSLGSGSSGLDLDPPQLPITLPGL